VADVRLRINFHDELEALGAETLTREAREQLSSLAASVDESLRDLISADWPDPEGSAALDEQRIGFGHTIDELREILATALEELELRVDASDVLPALSEPRGNGVAYEKFLAIYREMISAVESESESESADGDARFETIA